MSFLLYDAPSDVPSELLGLTFNSSSGGNGSQWPAIYRPLNVTLGNRSEEVDGEDAGKVRMSVDLVIRGGTDRLYYSVRFLCIHFLLPTRSLLTQIMPLPGCRLSSAVIQPRPNTHYISAPIIITPDTAHGVEVLSGHSIPDSWTTTLFFERTSTNSSDSADGKCADLRVIAAYIHDVDAISEPARRAHAMIGERRNRTVRVDEYWRWALTLRVDVLERIMMRI